MKLLKFLFIPLLFVVSFHFSVFAQNEALTQIITKTSKLYESQPIERVYLHFDKPYYAVGDTIWFKAYLTIDKHTPSTLSKIIYVDVSGQKDSVIQSLMLQVKNGVAWSSIPLSQYTFRKGNYRIVGYTNWMNNSGTAYYFSKNIAVGNAYSNDLSTQISLSSSAVNKLSKITAGIYYKDGDGKPYSNKKVSWAVQREDESVAKGRGETDSKGFMQLSFINLKNTSLDSAKLTTTVEDPEKKLIAAFPLKSVAKPNDIQFFPEGGELLVGITTKVAFKAIMPTGLGIDVKGIVTDNTNKTVAEFTSSHLGMGSFEITPEDGKTYKVKVTFADGSSGSPELPKIQTGGMNLTLQNTNPTILGLQLEADASFYKEFKDKTFFIVAKASGSICFAAKCVLNKEIYTASIAKSKLPTGIVQVTVFTDDGEPISERIAFIQHHDQLNLSLATDRPSYATRQKVKINIAAKNNNLPDEGNFSITVIDESKVPYDENSETTILTNLLLTSDIKGYIEKPNYYFNHPDEKVTNDLDILLLTQGYRRFSYDGIMNNKFPTIVFRPELGLDILGTLRTSTGIAVKNGSVRISIPDRNYFATTLTNVDGRFRFANLVFADSSKVNISARNNEHASDLVLTLDGQFAPSSVVNKNRPDEIMNIDSVLSAYLKNSKMHVNSLHILKEVVIRDKKTKPLASHKDYGNLSSLSSEPDRLIQGDLLNACHSLLQCLQSSILGMTFQENNFYVTRDYNSGKKIPAQVFVSGMPVDIDYLNSIDGNTVESVEVFLKDDLGQVNSSYNSNGAIVINLKKIEKTKISLQQLRDLIPPKNEITFTPKGYAPIRAFYLPRYTGPKESQTTLTDTRSTIYWNPNINTDLAGAASVEFYNADTPGSYRAIIEGFDKDGNLGRQVFRFIVK